MVPQRDARALSYCLRRQAHIPLCQLEFLVFGFELIHFRLQKTACSFSQRRSRDCPQARNGNRRADRTSDERKRALRQALQRVRERKAAARKKSCRAADPFLDLLKQAAQEVVQLFFRAHAQQLGGHFLLLRLRHWHFEFIHFAELIGLTGVLKLKLTAILKLELT